MHELSEKTLAEQVEDLGDPSQYDGSTEICAVPRNPIDHVPIMPGGS